MGDWDIERKFAEEYGWTPAVVDTLPYEFVVEQLAVWRAEAEARPLKGK